MNRSIATLPDSVAELCLIRLGLQVRRLSALRYAARIGRAIERPAAEAIGAGAGLLHSEPFSMGRRHFGVLQFYLNCHPMGLAAFGTLAEPIGSRTASRGRLGRFPESTA